MSTTFEKPFDTEEGQRETQLYEKEKMRQNSFSRLQEIRKSIREPNTAHLSHILCEKAGIIQGEPLSLDEASNCRPIFFNLYKDELDDLTEPGYTRHERNEEGDEADHARGLSLFLESYVNLHAPKEDTDSDYIEWNDIGCHDLYESSPGWQWGVNALLTLVQCEDGPNPNPQPPHIRCMIENALIGDDRLLRGEILAITRLMMARLQAQSIESHLMAPILVFSVMAPWHFRVLEAYFNGTNLVVRSTRLYDMTEKREDDDFLQNLTRWWFGSCGGETELFHVDSDLLKREKC